MVLAPPDPAFPDQRFEDLRAAFGFSGGVRMVTGRKRVDLTGLVR